MSIEQLRKYENWEGKSPLDILNAVSEVKGRWAKVFDSDAFPKGLPLWAHRVRNYFNHEPSFLTRLNEDESKPHLRHITRNFKFNRNKEGLIEFFSLSGDVYKDEYNRIWYQMGSGSTIYHYGSDPEYEELDAVGVTIKGQRFTPVFKLFTTDGTFGSNETIIFNKPTIHVIPTPLGPMALRTLESNIGKVDFPEYVEGRLNKDPWLRGSYNYAETVELGMESHKKYDIKPHKDFKNIKNVYVNPPNPTYPLKYRRFPVDDPPGKLLRNQTESLDK